jgi:hypothetical protein
VTGRQKAALQHVNMIIELSLREVSFWQLHLHALHFHFLSLFLFLLHLVFVQTHSLFYAIR